MAKALKTVGAIVGGVALIATGVGALGGLGLMSAALASTIGTIGAVASMALSTAGQLLTKPPAITAAQTNRLTASIDPQAGRKTVLGSTAFPLDVRHEEWLGTAQDRCAWIVAHASHAIESVDEIWINDELAWTAAGGTQGKFLHYFFVRAIVLEGTPVNAVTVGSWNAAQHRLTGCAYSWLEFRTTGIDKKAESPFSGGPPSRVTVIGKGAKLYDPRRDSTVPGGSGPMRADDQSTWRYVTSDAVTIGENLALQILRVKLGWRIKNPATGTWKLATGMGLPKRRVDLISYISAANLCDEAVALAAGGSRPRYRGAGALSEGEDPRVGLDMLCAACCGRITERSGKLGLAIAHNDLASAATDDGLNDDDVMGPFTWDPDPALESTPNVARGRYTNATANALYQLLPYPEIRLPSADGIDRVLTLDLAAVEDPAQAQLVAAQALMRKQYLRHFSAPFDIRAWKYRPGDLVPLTFAPLGFVRKLFRVVDQDRAEGNLCQMTLRVEDPAIYPPGGTDKPVVQPAAPNVYDTRNSAIVVAIGEAAETADAAIAQLDALGDDGILTPREKFTKLLPLNQQLAAEWTLLDGQAATLTVFPSVVSTRAIAASAYSAWQIYRDALSPGWNNLNFDTAVNRSVFSGKLEDLRYAIALLREALRAVADTKAGWGSAAGIYDPFDFTTASELHEVWQTSGAAEVSFVATSDTGGRAVQFGNNSGNDSVTLIDRRAIPYSPEDLYEVTFDVEGIAGTGALSLGVAPINAAGAYITPSDAGFYCYPAAIGAAQAGRRTYRGYFRGTAAVGGGNNVGAVSTDPGSPALLPSGTAKVAIVLALNIAGASGIVRVHEASLRKVVDAQVVPTGDWLATRAYYRTEGVHFAGRYFASRIDGNLNQAPPGSATSNAYWYLVSDKGETGGSGPAGLNNATITIYRRAASAPALPSAATTYTFATRVLAGLDNGWTTSLPAGTDPLYASAATASANTATDAIAANEWSAPVLLFRDGADGLNVATVTIYQRAASLPTLPSNPATFTFATGAVSGLNNGWSATIPNGTNPLYVSTATAASTGATDAIAGSEWAAARVLAQNGADGPAGASAFTLADVGFTSFPSPRSITKWGGGNAWNGKAYILEGGPTPFVSALLPAESAIGLTTDPTANTSFDTIDYALNKAAGGGLNLYRNGSFIASVGTWVAGDRLGVYADRKNAYYFKNGVELTGARHAVNADTETLYPVFAIYTQGSSITEVSASVAGAAGENGEQVETRYRRSLAQPATPTGADPAGWTIGVSAGTDTIWASTVRKDYDGNPITGWSTPQQISGAVNRGPYVATDTYYLNNIVSFNGGSYTAKQDALVGIAPSGTAQATAYWEVFAAPGAAGAPATPPSGFSATLNLTSGAAVNLRSVADAAGYPGGDATITFNVPNAVVIQGLGAGSAGGNGGIGVDTGSWPSATITLNLVVQNGGTVNGGGGAGGGGGGGSGGTGGDAIYCRRALNVTVNAGGAVRGGGGGGGGGATTASGKLGGGGGGGGTPNGVGGTGGYGDISEGSVGASPGAGGSPGGGAGGGYGAAGSNSSNSGGTGGGAGYAVRKNGFTVPVTNNGTMTGTAA